ncbi:MAG: D-2-hydroxyacid dehydrogenase [Burkholderiales bacterium]
MRDAISEAVGVLVSDRFPADLAQRCERYAEGIGRRLAWIPVPADPQARVPDDLLPGIQVAFYTSDVYETRPRSFFSAVRKAPNLRWLQTFNAGVDHPIFAELLGRGIRVTSAAGTSAVPIAQSAITGLLMLARGFPAWIKAQQAHTWLQFRGSTGPADLAGQTLCVLGMGSIGTEIARLGQALGLTVIGIRRSARTPADPVTEMHTPEALAGVLPRCNWLAIACPLTAETRRLIDGPMLARLPQGARVINVARGEIVDEPALIDALSNGHLAGAYLDVFEKEPLPPESPLWELPNVIVTPHNCGASSGNDARVLALFGTNLEHWLSGRALVNEVTASPA